MKGRVTQEQLAESLEMTQGGISSWLRSATQPNLEDINRIADAIGVSRVWLTHGLGYKEGPGKELLDTVMSGSLTETDLQALSVTAKALASARAPLKSAAESGDFLPPVPNDQILGKALAKKLAKHK